MRQRQRLQRLAELAVHDRVEEADALHVGQLDAAHALGAPQVEQLDLDALSLPAACFCFSTPMMVPVSVPGWAALRLLQDDLDLLAAGLVEDLAEGRDCRSG